MTLARGGSCRAFWLLCWFSYGLLLGQQLVDAWVRGAPLVVFAAKLLPLLIFLPGMLRDGLRSYVWLCFVSLLYFVILVERVFAEPTGVAGWVGLTAVVLMFCSAMLYVRWRGRELNPR